MPDSPRKQPARRKTVKAEAPTDEGPSDHTISSKPKRRQPAPRISAACEACKRRKTKCTGGPAPCQLCITLRTECVIDLSLDMRRREALKRTVVEHKSLQESLTRLLDCLRDGDSNILKSLTEILRSGTAAEDISTVIQHYSEVVREREASSDRAGTRDLSPVTTAGNLAYSQGISTVTDPEDEHHSHVTSVTGASSSPRDAKGKEREDFKDYSALLRFLRASRSVHSEDVLRRLIDPERLTRFLQNPPQEFKALNTYERAGSVGPEEGTASMELHQAIDHWRHDLQQSDRPGPTITATEGLIGIDSMMQGVVTGVEPLRSRQSSRIVPIPVTNAVSPDFTESTAQSLSLRRDRSGYDVLGSARSDQQPYVESILAPLQPDNTDLCVAHRAPGSRWRIPIHLVQPLTLPDHSVMGGVYAGYLRAARNFILNGADVSEFLGSEDEIVVDLLFRQRQPTDLWHSSSWACEVFRSFTEQEIYVRLAVAFFLTRFMRWLLVPSIENYEKLPDMMKPTATQRQIPHAGAIDLIPIPCVRDAAIAEFRDWTTPLGVEDWTVNWPFSERDAIELSSSNGSMILTTRFMNHVMEYDNWSVGSDFLRSFPEVAGKIRIHR